ncbi:hypothetical protein CDL15_Pgr029192 [Punica granatum]|uniref:Protein NUCLEAR FUSION DEFECTIVE 6, chloroplastic/mitochondrial-like n=1 Tax=Punica granatum TaxID=22663 RepID=A0A218XEB7_PUNGR|nr:hypothetical protein CDL15_Pgr029192 [Punica granatum]
MASRCRSLARPSVSLLKSTFQKSTPKSMPSSLLSPRSSPTFRRQASLSSALTHSGDSQILSAPQLGSLHSLLPLYSAVSSARLTSCLGIDSRSSRSMCQGMLCSANPGV